MWNLFIWFWFCVVRGLFNCGQLWFFSCQKLICFCFFLQKEIVLNNIIYSFNIKWYYSLTVFLLYLRAIILIAHSETWLTSLMRSSLVGKLITFGGSIEEDSFWWAGVATKTILKISKLTCFHPRNANRRSRKEIQFFNINHKQRI
jgi:hypothetical protein